MHCKPAITTVSLGLSNLYCITDKITQATLHGFTAIELFYDDLEALARSFSSPPLSPSTTPSRDAIITAAHQVRSQCDSLNVTILNLQPFRFYDGLADRAHRDHILSHIVPLWIDVLHIINADTILVPSNFLPDDPVTGLPRTVGDIDIIIDDLRQLALKGEEYSTSKGHTATKFAYEALAWGTHVNTWEKAWEIVQAVNLPNLGLAIDTFNIAGAIYADPTAEDGRVPHAEEILAASLHRMSTTLDLTKLFIVQIADAEKLSTPLGPGHEFYVANQPSRMSWSRNTRLFLCESERGGYLPVVEIVQVLVELGWTGYLAYEIFSRTLAGPDPNTPALHAERAARSWKRLVERMNTSTPSFSRVLNEDNVQNPLSNVGKPMDQIYRGGTPELRAYRADF